MASTCGPMHRGCWMNQVKSSHPTNHVLDEVHYGRHLANTIEQSTVGGDAGRRYHHIVDIFPVWRFGKRGIRGAAAPCRVRVFACNVTTFDVPPRVESPSSNVIAPLVHRLFITRTSPTIIILSGGFPRHYSNSIPSTCCTQPLVKVRGARGGD